MPEGRSRVALGHWLVLAAALLFVVAIIISRLTLAPSREAVPGRWRSRVQRRDRHGADPADAEAPDRSSVAEEDSRLLEELAEDSESTRSSTVSALLERTRDRRRRDQE